MREDIRRLKRWRGGSRFDFGFARRLLVASEVRARVRDEFCSYCGRVDRGDDADFTSRARVCFV